MADVMRTCDYISAHVYGWHRLALDTTDTAQYIQQKERYDRLFPRKPVVVSECGIHDSTLKPVQKIERYFDFYNALPDHWKTVSIYHYDEVRSFDKEYAVFP
jgi:hypothetical protein